MWKLYTHVQLFFSQISCKLLPSEDDDFRGGQAILEAMDEGSSRVVFSGTIYAFALQGCSQMKFHLLPFWSTFHICPYVSSSK